MRRFAPRELAYLHLSTSGTENETFPYQHTDSTRISPFVIIDQPSPEVPGALPRPQLGAAAASVGGVSGNGPLVARAMQTRVPRPGADSMEREPSA
jgi:hypothetical protein